MAVIQSEKVLEDWMAAGDIASRALLVGRDVAVPGARLVDVVERVEAFIREEGFGLAFPCTISVNACAAHYTPTHDDPTTLQHGDLIKLDCGAERNGALSDNAISVEVGGTERHGRLIEAAAACLKEAIAIIGPNANLGDVGAAIEMTAKDFGYKSVQNLTGHSLEPYDLHAGLTVPNSAMRVHRRPRIGDVVACEPFVTDGTAGRVENSGPGNIYHYQRSRALRLPTAKRLLGAINARHPKLPFAERWLTDVLEPRKLGFNLMQLQKETLLKHYPALSESSGGMVAQSEATLVITEDGCIPTTTATVPT